VTALLDHVLRPGALSVRFQGVYEINEGEVRCHYAEALTRGPRGTALESPDVLFEYARKRNREAPVDRACVAAILAAAQELPSDLPIGINVHASTLALDTEFTSFLGEKAGSYGISLRRLVIEIVEHAPPWDLGGFHNALSQLRHAGARIALDDVGLGHSNYMMILECRPDYFKIDRYFVHGAQDDYYRQAVLTSVSQLARPFKARVIAEGVETDEDLAMARATGIDLAQGFLFGAFKPSAGEGTASTDKDPAVITGRREKE
jgi:EAL domain-containing protein (putative c-di-GMP-specific phosphodiesterase class I)